jgi:preprotein translocase subunit SecY
MTILSSSLRALKFQLIGSDFLFSNSINILFFSFPDFINKIFFWLIYTILIVFFSKFYSKVILNPRDISEQLRKNSVIIRNINPGRKTQQYLTQIIDYLAKINAIIFMSLIIPLEILYNFLNIQSFNTNGFGLTSQIILINFILDTFRVIKTIDLSEKEIIE